MQDAYYRLGRAYVKLGRYREATVEFMAAIMIEPNGPYAPYIHYYLGLVYLGLTDRDSALEEYKILKDLDPELANDLFNLIYE